MILLLQKSITLKLEQTRSVNIDLLYEMQKKIGQNPEMHQVRFALKIHFRLQTVTRDVDQNIRAKVPVITQ